jgi:GTP-binding protein
MITDTPGLRRKSAITAEIEENMAHSSLEALSDADIVVLVVDGTEGSLVDQDIKLGFYAFTERHKALIIVINKDDITTDEMRQSLATDFDQYQHLIKKIPVRTISCITGKNVGTILPLIKEVWQRHSQTLSNSSVYHLFMRELEKRPLIRNEQRLIVFDVKQVASAPISFRLAVNEPAWFGPSQLTFFENLLRKQYDLVGVPIKFFVRKAGKDSKKRN